MRKIDIHFPSLDEKYLNRGFFKLSRSNYGTYSYFEAEYRRAIPFDVERTYIDNEVSNRPRLLDRLKEKLKSDDSVAISPNSRAYLFFKNEFRGDSFSCDNEHNILVPISSYKKIKTRK